MLSWRAKNLVSFFYKRNRFNQLFGQQPFTAQSLLRPTALIDKSKYDKSTNTPFIAPKCGLKKELCHYSISIIHRIANIDWYS